MSKQNQSKVICENESLHATRLRIISKLFCIDDSELAIDSFCHFDKKKILNIHGGRPMIVLMTDFGESEYVGMMKGVITTISPSAHIEDLTHSITPQSVREGAWVLLQSYRFFPHGTIFVCVVDPGVGTERAAVIIRTKNYVFVGPDNGLMYPAVQDDGIESVTEIDIAEPISATFHGRDVFAKVAAYVEQNSPDRFSSFSKKGLDTPLHFSLEGRCGEVVRIDYFGNIITNIPPLAKVAYILSYDDSRRDIKWVHTYGNGPDQDIFLVTGSTNTLEISAKNGRADSILRIKISDRITIE